MKRFLPVLLLLAALPLSAQTFTVTPATGSGPRTVTWNVPGGTNCQAGGDWSGTKNSGGTETVNLAVGTRSLTLACTVPGPVDKADLKLGWEPATQNTDGTPYTNPKGYQIFYGKTSPPTTKVDLNDPALKRHVVSDVGSGTWFAAIKSINTANVTSDLSGIVSKALIDQPTTQPWSATQTTDVTAAKPKAPVLSFEE